MNRVGIWILTLALGFSPTLSAGTNLSRAAISGDVAQVKACVEGGEDVNEIDKWGLTPLIWAVYYRSLPVAQYLLDHKANPNIQATMAYGSVPEKGTALIVAAYYGLDAHAALLLKYGANPDLTDSQNKKAIDYARTYRFNTIVAMLSKGKGAAAEKAEAPAKPPAPAAAPSPAAKEKPITNDDVMNMLLAYRGDVYVINKIKKAPRQALDVTAPTLAKLRGLGVSKAVVEAMVQRAKTP